MKIMKNSDMSTLCATVPLLLLCSLLPTLLGADDGRKLHGQLPSALRIRVNRFQSCPVPHLDNGRVTIRSRNRAAVFRCGKKYQLFGQKYSTCTRGHWTSPPPVCVRPGCQKITSIKNGDVLQNSQYMYSVLNFTCNPGYYLNGSPVIYCDGRAWNFTAPNCEADYEASQVACDFETEDLCGWTQEGMSEGSLRWFRHNGSTPSRDVGTGPLYDHTLGQGHDGHYLYIESSVLHETSKVARMFSPVYSPQMSRDACFTFWYHMYGFSVGSLNVYVKPEGVKIESVKPVFKKKYEQGDIWQEGFFSLDKLEVPFQIVIEGVRGQSFLSDIAFDDVRLGNGSRCNRSTSWTTAEASTRLPSTYSRNTIINPQSCSGRCGEFLSVVKNPTAFLQHTTSKVPELIVCDCHVGCGENNTCCSDFHTYCIRALNFSVSPIPITEKSVLHNMTDVATHPQQTLKFWTPAELYTTRKIFYPSTIPINTFSPGISHSDLSNQSMPVSDETNFTFHLTTDVYEMPNESKSNEALVVTATYFKPPVTHTPLLTVASIKASHHASPTPSQVASTPKTARDGRTTIPSIARVTTRPTTRAAARTTTHAPNRPTTRATTRPTTRATTRPTTRATTRPTTRATTRPTTRATTRSKTRVITRPTIPTTVRTPIRFTTSTKPHKITPALRTHHSVTTARLTEQRTSQATVKNVYFLRSTVEAPGSTMMTGMLVSRISAKQRSEKSTLPLAVAGMVIAILGCICAAVFVFIVVRRRRRRRHRDDLSDDSDVRFLTADEILDFTLATPKEFRDDDV